MLLNSTRQDTLSVDVGGLVCFVKQREYCYCLVGAAAAATIALLPVLQSIDLSVGRSRRSFKTFEFGFSLVTLSILPMCLDHLLKSPRPFVVDEVARASCATTRRAARPEG